MTTPRVPCPGCSHPKRPPNTIGFMVCLDRHDYHRVLWRGGKELMLQLLLQLHRALFLSCRASA